MLERKAFIFSLDAIFAVLIAAMMIIACFFHLSQTTTNIYQNQDIYKISSDSLAVLEKDNTLKTAIAASSTATIQEFLDSLPDHLCGNITAYTYSQVYVLSAQKSGCTKKNESAIAVRNFISNHSPHYAKMESWYR